MANRKLSFQPEGALARGRALRQSCAATDSVDPVRFKLPARFRSGRNTVFIATESLFT